jgi:peptidoglycan hydrolase CwlO-like protein
MWSSTLPTETVSNEELSTRTFPDQSTPSSAHQTGRQTGPATDEIERLRHENKQARAEIDQLETQVDRLEKQLANRQDSEQAIINRYEQVISELERAAATAPRDTPNRNRQTAKGNGIVDRISRWLSR